MRRAPGNGTVYWSKSEGRYVGEIHLGYDEDRKRIKRRLPGPRGDKSDDARLGLKDRLQQALRKRPMVKRGQAHSRITLGEYLDTWVAGKAVSPATKASYEWAIDSYLKPSLGAMRLYQLERKRLRLFINGLDVGDASKVKIRNVLGCALQDAVNDDVLATNPAARLPIDKSDSGPREVKAWSPAEAKQFLDANRQDPYYDLLLTMTIGSLGPAEAFGLKWRCVDFERATFAIVANLVEVGGQRL